MKILQISLLCTLLMPLELSASQSGTPTDYYQNFDGYYYDDAPPENPRVPDSVPYDASDDYFGKISVSPNAPGSYNMDYWQSPETPQGYPDKGPFYENNH